MPKIKKKSPDKMNEKIQIKSISKKISLFSIVILIIGIICMGASYYLQFIEYSEIGSQYVTMLNTNTKVKVLSMLGTFGILYILTLILNFIIVKNLKKFFENKDEAKKYRFPKFSLAFFIAVVGMFFTKDVIYQKMLLMLNSTAFNVNDPLFYRDIAYYIFQRPFYESMLGSISGILFGLAIYTVIYYILAFGVLFNEVDIDDVKKNKVFTHMLIMALIFGISQIFEIILAGDTLLYSKHQDIIGANFCDKYVWLGWYKIAPFIFLITLIITFIFFNKNKIKKGIITMLTFPAFVVLAFVISGLTYLTFVNSNKLEKEEESIQNNINYTRMGYNISSNFDYNIPTNIKERTYYSTDSLTQNMINSSTNILNSVQTMDKSSMLQTTNQTQAINKFYKFNDADIGLYTINGVPQLVYTSAREIDDEFNKKDEYDTKYQYTHGYGLAMSYSNVTDENGEPEYLVNGIPINSEMLGINITRPQIYYGELTNEHVIVNDSKKQEIDYLDNQNIMNTNYQGESGVLLNNIFNKSILSIKNMDLSILFAEKNSKVLINRNVLDRVEKVFPFLYVDDNPSLIVRDNGTLTWCVDAYTYTSAFPFSQYIKLNDRKKENKVYSANYIRNSVKILVDAYTGEVTAYIIDENDPIINTYKKMYPKIFSEENLPEDVSSKVVYPEKLFNIQSKILEKYHVTDASQFLNGEDIWNISTQKIDVDTKEVQPSYTLKTFPDSTAQEVVLSVPYTLQGKNITSGMIFIRSDKNNYGKIELYNFPRSLNVTNTAQISSNINSNKDITDTLSIWTDRGFKVTKGNISLIPIEDETGGTLLYIEPIYISSDSRNTAIPQLKKVIVGYQEEIVIGNDLYDAIHQILALTKTEDTKNSKEEERTKKDELVEQALETYGQAKWYLEYGDWKNYGIKMEEFDEIVAEILNYVEEEI